MSRERFTLNDLEIRTPLWMRLREHLEAEIAVLRKKNDDLTLDERKTTALRGEIAALGKLLAAERPPAISDD